MLAVVKFSFCSSPLEFSYIPSLLIMALCPLLNEVFRSPWWTTMGWVWLSLWRSTGFPCFFHVRGCSGSSHPAEDVIGPETSSFWEVSAGNLRINFFFSRLHVEQSRGRVTWRKKSAIQILNLLPLHEVHLTFYMENAYPKHSFLIPAWGAPDPHLVQMFHWINLWVS